LPNGIAIRADLEDIKRWNLAMNAIKKGLKAAKKK
jgi:hypothetical protein